MTLFILKMWDDNVRKAFVFALVGVVLVVLVGVLVIQQRDLTVSNPIDTGAASVEFTREELQKWTSVKNRVTVYNADPVFTGNRVLQWISMRNSSSGDYYQKSMEYLCFWEGQGANGEWEAVVSIYNLPNSEGDFVVEVARFTWHSLDVLLDGEVKASFPEVSEDDVVSGGYLTFHVMTEG